MRLLLSLSVLTLALLNSPVRADEAAELKALVKNALKAHGGMKNLKKYTGSEQDMEGKIEVMGMTLKYSGKVYFQAPGSVRNEMQLSVGGNDLTITTVIAGKKGWVKVNNMETQPLPKEALESANSELAVANAASLVALLGGKYKLSHLGEVKVNGKPAVGLSAERKGMEPVSLFFDKKTHYLVKMEFSTKDFNQGGKQVVQTAYLSNYKKTEKGVMQPRMVRVEKDGKEYMKSEVKSIVMHEKLDQDYFKKP